MNNAYTVYVDALAGIPHKVANVVSELESSMLEKGSIRSKGQQATRRKRPRGSDPVDWSRPYSIDTTNVGSGGFGGEGAKVAGLAGIAVKGLARGAGAVGRLGAKALGKVSLKGGKKLLTRGSVALTAVALPVGIAGDAATLRSGRKGLKSY